MSGFASVLAALALVQGEPTAPSPDDAAPSPAEARAAAPAASPAPATEPQPSAPAPASPPPSRSIERAHRQAAPVPDAPPARRSGVDLDPEAAAGAARTFLAALAAGDPDRLASAAAERFSFDGDTLSGRDAIRSTWRALLAGREGLAPSVGSVEALTAADAVARWGKPPARIASLVRPGVVVAVGDVGGRKVVLFLAREGNRVAVVGMHD